MANEKKKQGIAQRLLDKASSCVATKLPMYKQAKEDEKKADEGLKKAKATREANESINKPIPNPTGEKMPKGVDYSKWR